MPFDIGKVCYYGGNVPERAAVGNVTDTTTNEQLLLRQPLAGKLEAAGSIGVTDFTV
jgi:hypothetical protein